MAYHAGEATNSIEDTAVANETYVVDDLTIVPLNEKSYGTSGADAGCHSMQSIDGGGFRGFPSVGEPEQNETTQPLSDDTLQSREISLTSSADASEVTTRNSTTNIDNTRKKWSETELHKLMFCFFKAKAGGPGYMKRLEKLFKDRSHGNPKIDKFTGNILSNQARSIIARKVLSTQVLDQIKLTAEQEQNAQEAFDTTPCTPTIPTPPRVITTPIPAICELCSRIGRREQFYPRNNKFCSLRCHASNSRRQHCHWRFKFMEGSEHLEGFIPLEPFPQLDNWEGAYQPQPGPKKQSANASHSYEWKDELFGCDFLAAPVSLFKHAPLHEMWDSMFEGMKVEVRNNDYNGNEKNSDYLWVATVLKVKGYMGLLRYEGFGSDDSKDFWVNLCCAEVNPVGWCALRGKPLIPPTSIQDKYADWKKFLMKQLTGARTLPFNFYSKLSDSNISRFNIGSVLEVLDKNRISQVKVATVCEIIGKRLHIKYYDSQSDDMGFWCHEDSPLIHPVGWAFRIGHDLDAPENYISRVAAGRLSPIDTTPDMFYKYPKNEPPLFTEGMKLEVIDPLNLSSLCAATIMQILNEGYMMLRVDCYPVDESGGDWFCYHQRSPCIFPVGFAMAHNIPLTPPNGYKAEDFSWEPYLQISGAEAAPRASFAPRKHVTSHGFVAGMRLECTDLMDPRLVCVATIARVVGDLLKIHFDGWGPEYDQWLWAQSTDMYPVGWCRAVSHVLQGPNKPQPAQPTKRQPAKQGKAPRRRRKIPEKKVAPLPPSNENSNDAKSPLPPTTESIEVTPMDTESVPKPIEQEDPKMDVDTESKDGISTELPDYNEPTSESTQEFLYQPTESSQDSTQNSQLSTDPEDSDKVIPKLVNGTISPATRDLLDIENWSSSDVAKFLTVNDCQPYCQYFAKITGPMMLKLTKDDIIGLLKMKVGPSLKIFDLIQQLKSKLKKPQCRKK